MDNAGWSETFRRLLSVATDSAAEDARSLGSVAQRQSGAAAAVQNTDGDALYLNQVASWHLGLD
jgi:hypothetical protein